MLNKKIKDILGQEKGFTLIELLVVIAILGVLVTIGLSTISSARLKSRDSKRKTDLRTVSDALNLYYQENGTYPPSGSFSNYLLPALKTAGNLDKTNIADPLSKGNYVYKYASAPDAQGAVLSFCLTAVLEDSVKDKSDDEDGGPSNTIYEVYSGRESATACGNAQQ